MTFDGCRSIKTVPLCPKLLQNCAMNERNVVRGMVLLICGMSTWCAQPALAALGDDAASVAADAAELRGVVVTQPLQRYDIREITAAGGMRIREFLTRGGTVFAVLWSGPVMPDLQHLLGAHFAPYAAALASQNRGAPKRPVRIALPGLVVESEGHLRAYSGRAFLPALMPADTTAAELR